MLLVRPGAGAGALANPGKNCYAKLAYRLPRRGNKRHSALAAGILIDIIA